MPGVAEPEDALASGAPQIHLEAPGNRCLGMRWRTPGERPSAEQSVRLSVRQERVAAVPLEPRAVLATWDAATGELTMWISTQNPFRIRGEVSRILGLDEGRVRVIAPDVGGGFGVKGGPYRDEIMVAWLAHRLSALHDAKDAKIFDSIIVITDRRVLDRQLQRTISQFAKVVGVVENIDTTSKQLKQALAANPEARYSMDELSIAEAYGDVPRDMQERLRTGEKVGE